MSTDCPLREGSTVRENRYESGVVSIWGRNDWRGNSLSCGRPCGDKSLRGRKDLLEASLWGSRNQRQAQVIRYVRQGHLFHIANQDF